MLDYEINLTKIEAVDYETSVLSVERLLMLMFLKKTVISVERLLTPVGFVSRYIIVNSNRDLFQSHWRLYVKEVMFQPKSNFYRKLLSLPWRVLCILSSV